MNKEDGRKKQPFNEIDTECLDYIVNELKNNKSMQQMLNYYKGKYYSKRYWELKKQVDKAIEYIRNNCISSNEWTDLDFCNFVPTGNIKYKQLTSKKVKDLLDILRGNDNE